MRKAAKLSSAAMLIGAATLLAAGVAQAGPQAGPQDRATTGSGIAGDLYRPPFPNLPATQTDNPMQEPVEPDVFRRDQPKPTRPLTAISRPQP